MIIKSRQLFCKIALTLLIFVLCVSPTLAYAGETAVNADVIENLSQDIGDILKSEILDGAIVGVVVRLARTGEIVYSHNEDTRLLPASNLKLVTGAAALDTLGRDYRFKTCLYTDGQQRGAVLKGNLYLQGTGDPTMLREDYDRLVHELVNKGIKIVQGNLVLDDAWFDDVRLSNDLEWGDEPYGYGAQISALSISPDEDYDTGTVIVKVMAGDKIGSPAKIEVTPKNNYITIENHAVTVDPSLKKSIYVERDHGTNRIIVTGKIPFDKSIEDKSWISVWEPTGLVASIFHDVLKEKGIEIKQETIYDKTPSSATLIAQRESIPLAELMIPFQKLSNNGHAEILVKTLGKINFNDGSWDTGLKCVETYLQDIGINISNIRLRDGSGLSRQNLISAKEISQLLYHVQQEEWFPVYFNALPIAGIKDRLVGGTLRNRMQNTIAEGNVFAKTGSMTGVSAISGYVNSARGERLIFSIIFNNFITSPSQKLTIRDVEDLIVIRLAEF